MKRRGFWKVISRNVGLYAFVLSIAFFLIPPHGYSQTRDAIVKAKIEKVVKENMHDPSSYEFVALVPGVTITYKNNVYFKRENIKGRIESNKLTLQTYLENFSPLIADVYLDDILTWKTEIERDYLLIEKIDSAESALGNKLTTPVVYNYKFRCRGKNAFGAKVLNEYFVQVKAPTLEIMNIASETDKIIIDFGDFPGYRKIMDQEESLKSLVSGKAQMFVDSIEQALEGSSKASESRIVSGLSLEEATGSDEDSNKVYTVVEQQPEFEGGHAAMMSFLKKNMQYPASARRMGVDGAVYVSFLVSKDGSISEVKTIRGISPDCNKEAMRVVSLMPPWRPGRQNGKLVNVRFVLPIKFTNN